MPKYKVFKQIHDDSFVEIGQLSELTDAESVLVNYPSGMITDRGTIIQTKNLHSEDDIRLSFHI